MSNIDDQVDNGSVFVELQQGQYHAPATDRVEERNLGLRPAHSLSPTPLNRIEMRKILSLGEDELKTAAKKQSDRRILKLDRDILKLQILSKDNKEEYCPEVNEDVESITCQKLQDLKLSKFVELNQERFNHKKRKQCQCSLFYVYTLLIATLTILVTVSPKSALQLVKFVMSVVDKASA